MQPRLKQRAALVSTAISLAGVATCSLIWAIQRDSIQAAEDAGSSSGYPTTIGLAAVSVLANVTPAVRFGLPRDKRRTIVGALASAASALLVSALFVAAIPQPPDPDTSGLYVFALFAVAFVAVVLAVLLIVMIERRLPNAR